MKDAGRSAEITGGGRPLLSPRKVVLPFLLPAPVVVAAEPIAMSTVAPGQSDKGKIGWNEACARQTCGCPSARPLTYQLSTATTFRDVAGRREPESSGLCSKVGLRGLCCGNLLPQVLRNRKPDEVCDGFSDSYATTARESRCAPFRSPRYAERWGSVSKRGDTAPRYW